MSKSVEFATAKLAKEKGFNEDDCSSYFNSKGIEQKQFGLIQAYCKAPTQSELQAWLRDKHNIHVSVSPWRDDMDDAEPVEVPEEGFQVLYEGNVIDINDNWCTCPDYSYYHSYEECLESLLLFGLQLIKSHEHEN